MSVQPRRTASGERRYDVRLRRPDGTQYNRTFHTRKEADAFERSQRTARDRGLWTDPGAGVIPLGEYATGWLAARTVKGRPIAPRTLDGYQYLLRRYIEPAFGTVRLNEIEPAAVRAWHARLTRGSAPSVAAKAYRLLHAILVTAVDDGLIGANPCRVKGAGGEHTAERPVLSVGDVLALAEAIEPRWRVLVLVAAFGGLRFGELIGLRRQDVDLAGGKVKVSSQIIEMPNGVQLRTRPKSAAGVRSVQLPSFVVDELAVHLSTYVAPGAEAPLFAGTRGGVPIRRNWARIWGRARSSAGLPANVHLHDLRHAGATLAAQTGATTKELMARLGHASPRAALIYQHAAEHRDVAIAEALDKMVRDQNR